MTWCMTRWRRKPLGQLPGRLRPRLEFLEGRSSPSGLQPGDLLAAPLGDPVALSNAALAEVAPQWAVAQPAASDPGTLPAGTLGGSPVPTTVPLADPFAPLGGPDIRTSPLATPGTNPGTNARSHQIPVITNFRASEGENSSWNFDGVVVADNTWGLTIHFGGLASLRNETVETESDGTFHFTIRLQSGERGMATAQTTDYSGQDSNVATYWVDPTNGPR